MKGILGKKVGMTQIFNDNGELIPVTVIEAGPCSVVQKKTEEIDGYSAIQLGFKDLKENKVTKPAKGHFDKYGVSPKKYLEEFKVEGSEALEAGDEVKVDVFPKEIRLM